MQKSTPRRENFSYSFAADIRHRKYILDAVTRRAGEYASGGVHTNTIESVFALLKRGLTGTFRSVTRKHLHRYLSEFEFLYNSRHVDDGERTRRAIQAADGKRLTYKQQVG